MNRLDALLRRHIRTRYLVTLDNGEAFDGIAVEADERHLILADAHAVGPSGERTKVDGQLWLPRINIRYMQQPEA